VVKRNQTRRSFVRDFGTRSYRKRFIIAVEGEKTEKQYFDFLRCKIIRKYGIEICLVSKKHESAPKYVLKRMQEFLKEKGFRKDDEAWLVVDKDNWPEEELQKLNEWSQEKNDYGFVLSNPCFEFWLLLHFKQITVSSLNDCLTKLRSYLPDYDKGINTAKFTEENIKKAIERAKNLDSPPCCDWPRKCGTTVYRLVEKLFQL
jgi:hypothetical protein